MKQTGVAIAALWAAAWTAFGLAEALTDGFYAPVLVGVSVAVAMLFAAWYVPVIGGVALLIASGLAAYTFGPAWMDHFTRTAQFYMFSTVVAPPAIAGICVLYWAYRHHDTGAVHDATSRG